MSVQSIESASQIAGKVGKDFTLESHLDRGVIKAATFKRKSKKLNWRETDSN